METKVIKIDWKKKATKQQSQIPKNKTTPISSTEEFPLMGYYKDNLVDGITISKSTKWWSVIFLVKDRNKEDGKHTFVFYRWQRKYDRWLLRNKYYYDGEDIQKVTDAIEHLSSQI